jgi:hypothetical protein
MKSSQLLPGRFPATRGLRQGGIESRRGKYFCGVIEPTREQAVMLSPMEASMEGRFR